MGRIAVVYLARKGNPARWTRDFLASLAAHPPGADHDLVAVLKGYPPGETDAALASPTLARSRRFVECRISDDMFSIGAYFAAAEALAGYDRLLFLVSQSQLLAPGWLAHYLRAFDAMPACGLVGATGSWAASPGAAFPNVHLRSTGFMIAREVFLGLERGAQVTRDQGIAFEAGPDSMTRQIERRGLIPLVLDRDGRAWRADDWPDSRTFRSGRQDRLLIADNRTRAYAIASRRKRGVLARLAFGDRAVVAGSSLWSRLRAW